MHIENFDSGSGGRGRDDSDLTPIVEITVQNSDHAPRFSADQGVVVNLGRDIQFSFLQIGRKISAQKTYQDKDESWDGFDLEPSITEIAVGRMSPSAAVAMSLSTLDIIAETGTMKFEALSKAFASILEKAKESELK